VRRRGWFLFQVLGGFVLVLAAPKALHGLVEGLAGPYEVHAAPPHAAPLETSAPDMEAARRPGETDEPVSSP